MAYFVLVYDRRRAKLEGIERYDDSEASAIARDAHEAERTGDGIEVVVLVAASEDELRHTHGRYFMLEPESV